MNLPPCFFNLYVISASTVFHSITTILGRITTFVVNYFCLMLSHFEVWNGPQSIRTDTLTEKVLFRMKENIVIFLILFMNNFMLSEAFFPQLYLTNSEIGMTTFSQYFNIIFNLFTMDKQHQIHPHRIRGYMAVTEDAIMSSPHTNLWFSSHRAAT